MVNLKGNWPTVLNAFVAGGFGALGAKGVITPEAAAMIVTLLVPIITKIAHGMTPLKAVQAVLAEPPPPSVPPAAPPGPA